MGTSHHAFALLVSASSLTAFGQGLTTQRSLSQEAVLKVAQGTVEKCSSQGYKVSLSILDASGVVKLQLRGDGTGPHTLEHSRRKAYTALTFKRSSAEYAEAQAKRTVPAPVIDGVVAAAGGIPIRVGDEVVGSIGVSGAPGGEKDEACAAFGLSKIAELLK
jgi:uncharacterized protein GlcG (DUF336 family)